MKTALIVGASRGIGREFARQYKQAGWRVLATARDEAALGALEELGAETFSLDVTSQTEIAALGWKLTVGGAIGIYSPTSVTYNPFVMTFTNVDTSGCGGTANSTVVLTS